MDENILCVDFTETMTGDTWVEQMQRTKSLREAELNYYGICMFGEKDRIDGITSRFSLWRQARSRPLPGLHSGHR